MLMLAIVTAVPCIVTDDLSDEALDRGYNVVLACPCCGC